MSSYACDFQKKLNCKQNLAQQHSGPNGICSLSGREGEREGERESPSVTTCSEQLSVYWFSPYISSVSCSVSFLLPCRWPNRCPSWLPHDCSAPQSAVCSALALWCRQKHGTRKISQFTSTAFYFLRIYDRFAWIFLNFGYFLTFYTRTFHLSQKWSQNVPWWLTAV